MISKIKCCRAVVQSAVLDFTDVMQKKINK